MASALPEFVWLNGNIIPTRDARISPFEHGLLVGDGAFETLIAYRGTPFAMRRHGERLHFSCDALGIPTPDILLIRDAMLAVMKANSLSEARIRVTVTSGAGPLGSDKGDHLPTIIVAASALKPWPLTDRVIIVPWARNERSAIVGVKSISYAENVRALAHAKSNRASEAIFANTRDELCEGTGSNIFIVRGEEVYTPPLTSGCLAGVTRALAIELCKTSGILVREEPLPINSLRECDEAFLTSTTREVQAISHVDDRALPHAPGEMTLRLKKLFREMTERDCDP